MSEVGKKVPINHGRENATGQDVLQSLGYTKKDLSRTMSCVSGERRESFFSRVGEKDAAKLERCCCASYKIKFRSPF